MRNEREKTRLNSSGSVLFRTRCVYFV